MLNRSEQNNIVSYRTTHLSLKVFLRITSYCFPQHEFLVSISTMPCTHNFKTSVEKRNPPILMMTPIVFLFLVCKEKNYVKYIKHIILLKWVPLSLGALSCMWYFIPLSLYLSFSNRQNVMNLMYLHWSLGYTLRPQHAYVELSKPTSPLMTVCHKCIS